MILELFRKIFGCYSDQVPAFIYIEEPEDHVRTVEDLQAAGAKAVDKELAGIITNIMDVVVAKKSEGFISYVEDAMDGVTENRYSFIKYRNIKKKSRKK